MAGEPGAWKSPGVSVGVHGDVEDGFGPVADAFRANFEERKEVGAACAVVIDGRPVVDLWGGHRDGARTLPWERDTMVTVFSTTKGFCATAMAVAHSRGLFELDRPVATYWPEFAQGGKEDVTVRQLLSHEAGLAVIETPVTLSMLADHDALGAILAAQAPTWRPGSAHGYHAQSLGWYESQLLRRIDQRQRTIGRFFADEVAGPIDAEFHIGLPDNVSDDCLAEFIGGGPASAMLHIHEMPTKLVLALFNPRGMTGKAFRNPKALAKLNDINRRELLRIELPSVNGTGTARSMAAIYGDLASGGAALGISADTQNELESKAVTRRDLILKVDTSFSFGFMKPFPMLPFGSSERAYGHTGSGGSFAFADPDRRLGYAYAMNRAGFAVPTDPRELAIRGALDRTLEKRT